jgi:putative redox protein
MGVMMDIVYEGELNCTATHGPSGNCLTTDAPVDNGGKGAAFSPTDLVATALGTCMVTIMGKVAEQSGLDIRGTRISVMKDMTTTGIRRIQTLTVKIDLPAGLGLSDADKRKLEAAANTCPVKQSLHPEVGVRITFAYPE